MAIYENYKPCVTSLHLMLIPQQGLYSVMVKVMLAGEGKPIIFETPPTDNPRNAYSQAIEMMTEFLYKEWSNLNDVVARSQEPPSPRPSHPSPSEA